MMLAEQGARVIKVEPTDAGDPMRYMAPARKIFRHCSLAATGARNRSKSTSKRGRASRHPRDDSHRVGHNFRPGTMETLNLDFKTLERLNARLIYMAISGFN